jgi:small-conductance mechanosensitive channel
MPPTEDEMFSRWYWLDWWFAPRRRALLTWVVLGALMRGLTTFWHEGIATFIVRPLDQILQRLPLSHALFWDVNSSVTETNFMLLNCWFEPFALRLSLRRGAVWVVLRIVPWVLWPVALARYESYLLYYLMYAVAGVAAVFVLRGRRSRPWMAAIAIALTLGSYRLVYALWEPPVLLWDMIEVVLSGVLLLYGTRLLTSEERALRAA